MAAVINVKKSSLNYKNRNHFNIIVNICSIVGILPPYNYRLQEYKSNKLHVAAVMLIYLGILAHYIYQKIMLFTTTGKDFSDSVLDTFMVAPNKHISTFHDLQKRKK